MAEQSNTPQLRFQGYTDAWGQVKLGDIADRITRKNANLESNLPLTISAQYGLIDQNEFFDKRIASKDISGYYLLRKGEYAYNKSTSNDAPWGAVKRLEKYDKGVVSTLYIVFSLRSNIDSDYFATYYSTDLWHRGIQEIASEGARNHGLLNIAPNDFFNTAIKAPKSLDEQKKIGSFFQSLDAMVALHQRKLSKLQETKKSLLQNMFPAEGEDRPKIRFAGYTYAWGQVKLGGIAEEYIGGGTPKTSIASYWKGDIPWFQSADISADQVYSPIPKKFITKDAIANSATKLVPANSIAVITRVGVGKLANIGHSYCTSQDFLSFSKLKTNPNFTVYSLYKKLNEEAGKAQGTSIKGITKDELLDKEIMVPKSEKEQGEIGSFFKNIDSLLALHQRKLEKLQQIKKALLQKMFC